MRTALRCGASRPKAASIPRPSGNRPRRPGEQEGHGAGDQRTPAPGRKPHRLPRPPACWTRTRWCPSPACAGPSPRGWCRASGRSPTPGRWWRWTSPAWWNGGRASRKSSAGGRASTSPTCRLWSKRRWRRLREYPILNSTWEEDRIVIKRRINIGIAVDLDDGSSFRSSGTPIRRVSWGSPGRSPISRRGPGRAR